MLKTLTMQVLPVLPSGCSSDGFHVSPHLIDMRRDSGISWTAHTFHSASSWLHSANYLFLASSISMAFVFRQSRTV